MRITIDLDTQATTAADLALITLLADSLANGDGQPAPTVEPEEKPKRKPRKKAEPAHEEPELPLGEPAEEQNVNDEIEGQTPPEQPAGEAPTLEDAMAKATALIRDGKSGVVKAALNMAGVGRVSELSGKPDAVAAFMKALEA